MMTLFLIIGIENKYYSVHPFFLFINVTLVTSCVVNPLIMYVTCNINLMLSKEKKTVTNLPVACPELCTPITKNLLQSMNLELRKGKKRKLLQ